MKQLCVTTIFLVMVCLVGNGAAAETKDIFLGVGLWTRHVSPSKDTNEDTHLVIMGYQKWVAAYFKNSYHHNSFFGGRILYEKDINLFDSNFFLRGNLYGGILYGYKEIPNLARFTPALFPSAYLGYDLNETSDVGLELIYIPTGSGGVFTNFITFHCRL